MLTATLLAGGSAFLHAAWNLLLKTSTDRAVAFWGQFVSATVLVLPVMAFVGLPGWAALPWLAMSALVHVLYAEALTGAYVHGDFSFAYPLARGGGALVAAVGGVALLGDRLTAPAWVGVAVVAVGLASLAFGGQVAGWRWALVTALSIATYTLVDAHGARLSASGVTYGLATFPCTTVAVSALGLVRRRGRALRRALTANPGRFLVGGACTAAAYTMVMVAVRLAPVGYVTVLRESSVVLGALAGWLVLREALGRGRLASSTVVLGGLILLVTFGR